MPSILQPLFGAFVILAIAVLFSTNRRAIYWPTVAWGLGLQVLFALVVLKTAAGEPTASEALGHQEFVLTYKSFDPIGPGCLPVVKS